MSNDRQPAVQRRRLRTELKRVRSELDLTQSAVARALEWSHSKLIRVENGESSISPTDLRALTSYYRERGHDFEPGRVDELLEMARGSKRQPFAQYRDVHGQEFLTYLGYEASASIIRQFEPLLIPGLAQIEEYAFAIRAHIDSAEVARRRWEVRSERQLLLEREQLPQIFFILDEAAVRRVVGGPGVMRRQLEHLRALSTLPDLTLQIMPFSAGAYPGMHGPFTVLEFPSPEDDNILYTESPTGETTTSDDRAEEPYLGRFLDMEDTALKGDDVDALLDDVIRQMSQ